MLISVIKIIKYHNIINIIFIIKIVISFVLHDLDWRFSGLQSLSRNRLAVRDKVKDVALLVFSDDVVAGLVGLFFERVSELRSLLGLQGF